MSTKVVENIKILNILKNIYCNKTDEAAKKLYESITESENNYVINELVDNNITSRINYIESTFNRLYNSEKLKFLYNRKQYIKKYWDIYNYITELTFNDMEFNEFEDKYKYYFCYDRINKKLEKIIQKSYFIPKNLLSEMSIILLDLYKIDRESYYRENLLIEHTKMCDEYKKNIFDKEKITATYLHYSEYTNDYDCAIKLINTLEEVLNKKNIKRKIKES